MANTFSQIYLHFVFAPKGRQNLIRPSFKEELYKYITGIVRNKGQKLIIVNGMADHIHLFIGLVPNVNISDFVRDIKSNSSKFMNEKKFLPGKFEWQEGFGVFSYSYSQIDSVYKYIENQEKHHKKKTFRDEYIELLRKFNIEYDPKYIFETYNE